MRARENTFWKASLDEKLQKENVVEQFWAIGTMVLFDVICALLFWYAAWAILEEVYPQLNLTAITVLQVVFVVVILSGCMETASRMKRLPAFCVRLGVGCSGAFILYWNLKVPESAKAISSGFQSLIKQYLTDWNEYYGTAFYSLEGDPAKRTQAVVFVLFVLLFFLLFLAKCWKNDSILSVMPLLILVSQLLVGQSPKGKGIILLFVGILLANSRGFSFPDFQVSSGKGRTLLQKGQFFVWIPAMAGIVLLCGVFFLFGRERAENDIKEYAIKTQTLLADTVEEVAEWEIWKEVESSDSVEKLVEQWIKEIKTDTEVLGNEEPLFQNIPYLRLWLEEKPLETLYLKGFLAGRYEDGVWSCVAKEFEQACKEAGYDPLEVSKQLAFLGVEKLKKAKKESSLSNFGERIRASLFYYESGTENAYLPYFSEAGGGWITVVGEGTYDKEKRKEQLDFILWRNSGSYVDCLGFLERQEKETWENWYETYVEEQYLTVPDQMRQVKAAAKQIQDADDFKILFDEADTVNEKRLTLAYLVAEWLGRTTSYSKKLPKLPPMTDPVEYFLGTSQQGYCMHYASAAVMILRELGVPSRYASGYVVNTSSFLKEGQGYQSIVLDNQAHAWAEIYLEGMGWIPVEVTKGYRTSLPVFTPSPTAAPTPVPTNTQVPLPTKLPEPTKEAMRSPTPVPDTPSLSPTLLPEMEEKPFPTKTDAKDTVSAPEENELGKESREWYEVLGIIAGGSLTLIVLLHFIILPMFKVNKFFRIEKVYHKRLLRVMKKGGNRWAIKMINQSIYRQLLFNGKVKRGLRDPEYKEALKKQYTEVEAQEWDRYMNLVIEAEFSKRAFTEEEVEFCYKIYRDAVYGK